MPNIATLILILAALVWLSIRQTTWSPVDRTRMFRSSAILAGIGVLIIIAEGQASTFDGTDIALLLLELVVGGAVGALIGLVAHLRPITGDALRAWQARAAKDPGSTAPRFEARNGWLGLVIWLTLIAARIGFTVWEASIGGHLAQAGGVLLLLLAVNRLVRSAVILSRAPRVLAPSAA